MSTDGDTLDYPAFKATYRAEVRPFVAADADGDGIADAAALALLFQPRHRIPYLPEVPALVHAAPLNLNTAWSRYQDFDSAGSRLPNSAYFRSGVGLLEVLNGAQPDAELAAINQSRFGGSSTADTTPRTDTGSTRGDFRWRTQG